MGTELVVESVPEGIALPDNTEWSKPFKDELNIEVPPKGRARYVEWMRLYALDDEDFNDLLEAAGRVGQVMPTEQDVLDQAESFRGNTLREANTNGTTPTA
jgi:hypothetical protein